MSHDSANLSSESNQAAETISTSATPGKARTVYTVTRTYVAPNGQTKTKTFEYYDEEAQKVRKQKHTL